MDSVVTSPSWSLNKAGGMSILRHTILPLACQGAVEVLQSFDVTSLSPGWYVLVSAGSQGAIQFLNKFLREHKNVV